MTKLSIKTSPAENGSGWLYYALQLLVLPEIVILVLLLLELPVSTFSVNFTLFCLNFLALSVIFRRFLHSSLKIMRASARHCFAYAGLGFVYYWVLNTVLSNLILRFCPAYFNLNNASVGTMAQEHFLLMSVGTVLLVPPAEELVFRGLIFQGLYNKSRLLAYAVSATAFSAIHVVGYLDSMDLLHAFLSFVQYLPAGLTLGWAYAKTDTIWTPILMHAFINLIGIFAVR